MELSKDVGVRRSHTSTSGVTIDPHLLAVYAAYEAVFKAANVTPEVKGLIDVSDVKSMPNDVLLKL